MSKLSASNITTRFIKYARSRIVNIIKFGINMEPRYLIPFIPYKKESNYYVIHKQDSHNAIKRNEFPIPSKNLWVGYGKSSEQYLSSGERHVLKMKQILNDAGFSITSNQRILDFGCAAGRMIRFLRNESETCSIWGTDISAEHIVWCKQNLSPHFSFFTATTFPHLPFEDNYFDLIYAGSVFTHIDDLADAWLLELRRILKPNGYLYITIQDNRTIHIVVNGLPRDPDMSQYEFSKEESDKLMNHDFAMFTYNRSVDSHVFYDTDYLLANLSNLYKVVSVNNEAYGYQTAILLKKESI